ncbi:MAG: hypothetical protein AAF657_02115 [Acidobacteriota bacterium]
MESEPTKRTPNVSVDTLVGRAKDAISKASYQAALELLQQAVRLAPEDREAQQLLRQTEEASRRHQAAIARYQEGVAEARRIGETLRQGDLVTARRQLVAAQQTHGQHDALAALGPRLAELEAAARGQRAAELVEQAKQRLAADDWQSARSLAEQSSRLAPSDAADEVRQRAQTALDRQAEHRHYHDAVDEARDDVERLIEARELARAGQRLRQATDQLGRHEGFDALAAQIDKAKADHRFRQKIEWAERRANEAARLLAEADRLSGRRAYQEAIERLEEAHKLDPSHPDIEDRLAVARQARQQQIVEQERTAALERQLAEVKSHLDALRLDAAAEAIRLGRETFGEPQRFAPLATRLERLRDVERSGGEPMKAGVTSPENETEMLRRQRALAEAYSWQQALLYPFRGPGVTLFWGLLALLLVLDLLAALPAVGWLFVAVSLLVIGAALGRMPAVVRSTLAGANLLPPWRELADWRSWGRDLPGYLGFLGIASFPLLALLGSRGWYGGLDEASGPIGFVAVALLAWLFLALVVVGSGAMEAFGRIQALRLARHLRGFAVGQIETLLTVNGFFVLGVSIVVLYALLVPAIPWLGLPLVRALQIYGLLVAPHLIGVLVRRHRLELSKVYG